MTQNVYFSLFSREKLLLVIFCNTTAEIKSVTGRATAAKRTDRLECSNSYENVLASRINCTPQ